IVRLDAATNQFVGVPIDLGSDTDQVYLTLYGAGWRSRPSLDSVSVTVEDVPVSVVYAGAALYYDDLDMVTVLLPQRLGGLGNVAVVLTVDGQTANVVRVLIQ
ncbi:MAG: hypothetical protein LAO55_28655, partial [Acidobacteriia bacterium]|nr:hypothetical protein [Terriglobia bacterium]